MEVFEEVRLAEAKAEEIAAEAANKARELIKNAEAACMDNERKAAREHRALYQSMLEKRRADMQSMLDANTADALKAMEDQMRGARKRLSKAASLIVERVLNDGNR